MSGLAFGLPAAVTAAGLAGHLGWVLPWDGRRSLRATVDIISKDVEVDEQRRHLPAHAQTVQLFTAVLRLVAENPDGWRAGLTAELPFVDGSPLPLSAVERARLDRYVGRLENALARYGRRVRFSGGRVAKDVAGVVFDPRSYWNGIDLTDPDAEPEPVAPSREIDVTGTGEIDVRTAAVEAKAGIDTPDEAVAPDGPTLLTGGEAPGGTGIRSVAGVELGVRAEGGDGTESASGAKSSRLGPRRRSRH